RELLYVGDLRDRTSDRRHLALREQGAIGSDPRAVPPALLDAAESRGLQPPPGGSARAADSLDAGLVGRAVRPGLHRRGTLLRDGRLPQSRPEVALCREKC